MNGLNQKEAALEREHLAIGLKVRVSDVLNGVDLHIPMLSKFVGAKFAAWPRRLQDCESFAGEVDAALIKDEAKFYLKLQPTERAEALLRVALWQAWENKHLHKDFQDRNCGDAVSIIKQQNGNILLDLLRRVGVLPETAEEDDHEN